MCGRLIEGAFSERPHFRRPRTTHKEHPVPRREWTESRHAPVPSLTMRLEHALPTPQKQFDGLSKAPVITIHESLAPTETPVLYFSFNSHRLGLSVKERRGRVPIKAQSDSLVPPSVSASASAQALLRLPPVRIVAKLVVTLPGHSHPTRFPFVSTQRQEGTRY